MSTTQEYETLKKDFNRVTSELFTLKQKEKKLEIRENPTVRISGEENYEATTGGGHSLGTVHMDAPGFPAELIDEYENFLRAPGLRTQLLFIARKLRDIEQRLNEIEGR